MNLLRNDFITSFKNKSILITGATGLIGSRLIKYLLKLNRDYSLNLIIIACIRNLDKAKSIFQNESIVYVVGNITEPIHYEGTVDFIVHAASNTSSKKFIQDPVGVIQTAINGTENILGFAKKKRIEKLVYLSSMEVYGYPQNDERITEESSTNLNTMKVRSSYPESKRMCELLCTAYYSQYKVPAVVARLTQTIGSGIDYNDGRVFAEFARCAVETKNIVLKSEGKTRRDYLSVKDAVKAILYLLIYGEAGEAYNVANEETYCSILNMAELICNEFADQKIIVEFDIDENEQNGYAPVLTMNLDTSKIRKLGWKPQDGLKEMFSDLIAQFKTIKCLEKNKNEE